MATKDIENKLQCMYCNKYYKSELTLTRHKCEVARKVEVVEVEEEKPLYKCPCGKEYKTASRFATHVKECAGKPIIIEYNEKCKTCGKNFTTAKTYNTHVKTCVEVPIKKEKQEVTCVNCQEVFPTQGQLNNHNLKCTVYLHVCKVCFGFWKKKTDFDRHLQNCK